MLEASNPFLHPGESGTSLLDGVDAGWPLLSSPPSTPKQQRPSARSRPSREVAQGSAKRTAGSPLLEDTRVSCSFVSSRRGLEADRSTRLQRLHRSPFAALEDNAEA